MEKSPISLRDIVYLTVLNANSPLDFTGHIGKINDFTRFSNFVEKLNEWCEENGDMQMFEDNSINCSYVLVKQNKLWTRAKVLCKSKQNKEAQLFLMDEGISKIFSHDEIRLDLPDFYHDIEPKAKHFRISSPPYESNSLTCSSEANSHFLELITKYAYFRVKQFEKIRNKNASASFFSYTYTTDLLIEENKSLFQHFIDKDLIQIENINDNCEIDKRKEKPFKEFNSANIRDADDEIDDGDGFVLVYKKVYT